jgi:dipeptidyl aminopeptidase/acylaminoacyl peptidase
LIFTPDIHYTIGKPAESIINSVLSGVEGIKKFSFVDSTKIGIEGHSFGGYETNVLVTHSNVFAAAIEGAGPTDLVSAYGTPLPTRWLGHFVMGGQNRIPVTVWQDRSMYIQNSPIFFADRVTSPLLMMHNKNDEMVSWSQAIEFFIALRRLNKPVWMLQYDKGKHGVHNQDAIDYTTRMTQYFDHYLKGAPAPKWMTQGIPAKLKGIDNGLELDPNGKCSETCPVCNKINSTTITQ